MGEKNENYSQTNIAEDFMPEGWQWVYDETEPTNRKLYQVLSENSYEDTYKTLLTLPGESKYWRAFVKTKRFKVYVFRSSTSTSTFCP